MGNGNRSVLVDNTEKAASEKKCDVGLRLRMQTTEPFSDSHSIGMRMMPHYSSSFSEVGVGGDGGGWPFYCSLSNQVPCFTDSYDVFGSAPVSSSSFKSSGGDMAAATAAKVTFTETQWQELVRQTTIYKYMMASIPVPPQLLIPTSKSSTSPLVSAPQCTMSGFSRNSDTEPWRCRRTDGKKWRCARDVAPNQKYCERHAHKTKPRSRKPVELPPSQSHHNNTTNNDTSKTDITNTNFNAHSLAHFPPTPHKPTFPIPAVVSGPTYAQPRCTEWLMKGDSITGSTLDHQQWQQQLIQSSSREGLKRYNEDNYRNWSALQQHYDEQPPPSNYPTWNSYFDLDDGQRSKDHHHQRKVACLQGVNTDHQTQATRHFIDAWSSEEREAMDELSNKYYVSSKGKLPLSSGLSLSMSRDDGLDDECRNAHLGLEMMNPESERGSKSQWLDPVSWMGSPPGGPLGEALCLGISSGTPKEAYHAPSPHCYSNSTTTSSCSKSSCEDAGHGLLHFH